MNMKRILFTLLTVILLLGLALPTPAMAKAKWDLEGWRIDSGKWMDGLLFTYYEGNWVPYRLEVTGYDGDDLDIAIQHDYLDANGHYGVDGARDFFIGPQTGRPNTPASIPHLTDAGGGFFDVVGPTVVPVSNGSMLEYHFIVPDAAALTAFLGTNDFAFYWEAHYSLTNSINVSYPSITVEFGSGFWNGASLHAHTSVTGNQDVPIKTPSQDLDVAADDAYATDEDMVLSVAAPGVLGNDTDVDGDALTAVLNDGPGNGTLTLNADGSFTYTPDENYNGLDSFTYQASDSLADSNTATVTITVNPVNDEPVAVGEGYSVDEDNTLNVPAAGVLVNDNDVDGDALTAVLDSSVGNGTLTLNADGSFTYTPNENYNGTDTFTYYASDSLADSNTATVTITVNPINDAPIAVGDEYSVDEDNVLNVPAAGVLANDTDIEGSPLTAVLDGGVGNGTLTLNADGSFTYTPNENYNGTDTFTYYASDGTDDSNTATVTITVNPINDAPVALDEAYSVDEDNVLTVGAPGVLTNDTDADGDPLTAVLVSDVSHGTLTLNTDGSFTYTPRFNYYGPDSFTYLANDTTADSNIATVTITVNAVNDPPTADAGQDQTVTVGDLVTLEGISSSDPVEGDLLTYAWVFTARPDGSAAILTDASTVSPTFVPDLPGDYIVELTVDDGNSGSGTDNVTVTAAAIGMTISLEDSLVGVGRTTNGTITLDHPAPPGGIMVTLSLDTAVATVDPADVPIAEGSTEGTFVLTGAAVGTTMITGTSPVTGTATADVEVTVTPGGIVQIIDATGDGTGIVLQGPLAVATNTTGNAYVAGFNSSNVIEITPGGSITEIIDATGDGTGNPLYSPVGVAVDTSGNVYVTGRDSDNVFKVTPGGNITEIIDATGDGAGNTLETPGGVATDAAGNVYVTGRASDNVFKVTPGGSITEIIDATGDGTGNTLNEPFAVATDTFGNVYVTGRYSDNVFKVTPGGIITEIIDATGDGAGNTLDWPVAVAVDTFGNVYVTGQLSDNVFKVTPGGSITEIIDATGDGTGNTLADPSGVATDAAGNAYVTGRYSDNVFKVTPGGIITEIIDATGDGAGNTLSQPFGVAVDLAGNVYVTGSESDNVFKVWTP